MQRLDSRHCLACLIQTGSAPISSGQQQESAIENTRLASYIQYTSIYICIYICISLGVYTCISVYVCTYTESERERERKQGREPSHYVDSSKVITSLSAEVVTLTCSIHMYIYICTHILMYAHCTCLYVILYSECIYNT